MSESGVRRDKAVPSSGSHPANVPAGSNRSSYEPVRTHPKPWSISCPSPPIGTGQLEVEAEHTAPFCWFGAYRGAGAHNRTRSKFWGGHAARSTQMSIHAAARMSDSSLDRGLE